MLHKPRFNWQKTINWVITLCITLMVIGYTLPAKADVIYQAFNMPFQEIKNQLSTLKADGFTYIQVSPPEKSNPSTEWWARYQPIDFTVFESPLGNEDDLRQLIDAAHEQDIKILVDVIINHMANYPPYSETLDYPRFSPEDFHPKSCIDYNNCYEVTHGWLGFGCDLPDLKTESDYVQGELKNYFASLIALGADGFRIDAIKHVEVADIDKILDVVPADKYVYGEVIGGNCGETTNYPQIHNVDITDYNLLSNLKGAFSFGGDLRSLINPQGVLPGYQAITFSKTHDTVCPGGDLCGDYGFEPRDQMLANAFLLARQDGLPLIYRDDIDDPIVPAGAKFHEKLLHESQYFRNGNEITSGGDSPNRLFIERGDQGIAIINKAGESFAPTSVRMPGLEEGCYQELISNSTMCVNADKSVQGGLNVAGRSAVFFVKQ
ncbi:MAG: alpha-amylase family glycosyl hydrolase [Crocosphaera sp.]|nr:alpha-amylase family glycosyl hydrolase [Crocosphaera sp.]